MTGALTPPLGTRPNLLLNLLFVPAVGIDDECEQASGDLAVRRTTRVHRRLNVKRVRSTNERYAHIYFGCRNRDMAAVVVDASRDLTRVNNHLQPDQNRYLDCVLVLVVFAKSSRRWC